MNRFVASFLILCVVDLFFVSNASAQWDTEHLKGLTAFDVVVEQISSNICGVDEDDVKSNTQSVLTQSRMPVDVSAPSDIYVNVNVLDDCTAAQITISVNTPVTITRTNSFAIATVWSEGVLLSGRADMKDRVMREVQTLTKKLVVDWSSMNP
jgi:hypothetical protein